MECLNVNQILCLYRCGLLSRKELIKAYNHITCKVLCENDAIDSVEVYNEFVEAVRRAGGIPAQVNTQEVVEISAAESMITQQLGAGPSTQAGPSSTQKMFKHINVIGESDTKFIKKFNTTCRTLKFTFNDETCKDNPLTWLQSAFEELHTYIVKDAAPSDRVGIALRNPNFPDKPIGLSFRRVDQLSVGTIMEKVMQSNASIFSSDLLVLNVDRVRIPVGYGRKNLTGLKYEYFYKHNEEESIDETSKDEKYSSK